MFCRRFGVPLIDGGTVRLTRLMARAGHGPHPHRPAVAATRHSRSVSPTLVAEGEALAAALALAHDIAAFPQRCMRNDRASVRLQHGLSMQEALAREVALGRDTLAAGEAVAGARRFVSGTGRHGGFDET